MELESLILISVEEGEKKKIDEKKKRTSKNWFRKKKAANELKKTFRLPSY